MSVHTKEQIAASSLRPFTPSTSTLEDETLETPEGPSLGLPKSHLTFAFVADSQSDLRLVSFVCADGDDLDKAVAFLPHDLEAVPSDEEWYRNMDRDTVCVAPPGWTPPQTPLNDEDHSMPLTHLDSTSPLPPHSSMASAFAFFQNHFLNGPDLSSDSDTSGLSSASCYSCRSGEPLFESEEFYYDFEQPRGTVISSTLGGLDVYMRTGSIIHWTHHPQYAAQIKRSSQPSFLCELSTWEDGRFEFDPVTPFARDWHSKRGIGQEGNGCSVYADTTVSSECPSIDFDWETVQTPALTTNNPMMGASPASPKRLKKRKPSPPSSPEGAFMKPKAKATPPPGFRVFAPFETMISCPNRRPAEGPTPSTPLKLLLPRPHLDAVLQSGSRSSAEPALACRQGTGNEPWVWVDITRRPASSER